MTFPMLKPLLLSAVLCATGALSTGLVMAAETEVQTTIPATSTEIWRAIDGHIAELEGLIAKHTLKTVHQHAYAVRDLVRALPTHSPGLSAAALSSVSAQVKFVDTLATRLDASGDANDKTGTAANLAKLVAVMRDVQTMRTTSVCSLPPVTWTWPAASTKTLISLRTPHSGK